MNICFFFRCTLPKVIPVFDAQTSWRCPPTLSVRETSSKRPSLLALQSLFRAFAFSQRRHRGGSASLCLERTRETSPWIFFCEILCFFEWLWHGSDLISGTSSRVLDNGVVLSRTKYYLVGLFVTVTFFRCACTGFSGWKWLTTTHKR